MSFSISQRDVRAGDRSGTAYVLSSETARAEVWPSHGFNCLKWQVRDSRGNWDDILFSMPDWEQNAVPTRSGHPILFPFPNRLRHGTFSHAGKTYQLPLTESSGKHAIHGFTPRIPWRVIESGASGDFAFVTGEYQISVDTPAMLANWPADARLRLTYRLSNEALTVTAVVDAADGKELPFGLGYHPYFCAPGGTETVDNWHLTINANKTWELEEGMPNGQTRDFDPEFDFRKETAIGQTVFDTAYTDLIRSSIPGSSLHELARLEAPGTQSRLIIAGDSAFRDLVIFTPVHRKAIAIEPYTCATDSANREGVARDRSGWKVLSPGDRFMAVVEYRIDRSSE